MTGAGGKIKRRNHGNLNWVLPPMILRPFSSGEYSRSLIKTMTMDRFIHFNLDFRKDPDIKFSSNLFF
jgi:hypothetical protein